MLIQYDPLAMSFLAVEALARAALARPSQRTHQRGRMGRIPVRYGGEDGPDLAAVAQELGLSPGEAIRLHASPDYRVSLLGLLAGFPYLGAVPASRGVSRLST